MLELAKKHGLMVILTLWDYQLTYCANAKALLKDESRLQSYLDKALTPLVSELEDVDNIVAWEVINEPEWLVENFGESW